MGCEALEPLRSPFEIVFVDDGSRDLSYRILMELAAGDERVKVVRLRRNFGQTAALQAAIDHSRGDVLVTMDGDLQNDPADIPAMIARLDDGFDAVLGQRVDRKDGLTRTVRVLLDLMTVQFLNRYLARPMHLFGLVGLSLMLLGLGSLTATIVMRIGWDTHLVRNPLLLLSVMLELCGVQLLSTGLLGELLARTYFESQDKAPYAVRETRNLDVDREELNAA